MPSFDEAWAAVAVNRDGEAVSQGLRPLLAAVYREIFAEPFSEARLAGTLKDLLEFLAGPGRTNANCWAADSFFGLNQGWERDWGDMRLPGRLRDVLSMMGEALHDTVRAPGIAENFGCLSEQLLERVRRRQSR